MHRKLVHALLGLTGAVYPRPHICIYRGRVGSNKMQKGSEGGEWKRGGKREEEGGKCVNLA